MSWYKVDDRVPSHPKFKKIRGAQKRLAAVGLWTFAGAWSAQFETDGEVPSYILEDLGDTEGELTGALVEVGLWDATEDGIAFHDWAEYQPTRAAKDEKRAAEAERVRKWRQDRKRDQEKPATSGKSNGVRAESVRTAYASPDPTRPDPTPTTTTGQIELLTPPPAEPRKRGGAFIYPDAFEVWWKAYPRKDDKRKACEAWKTASKSVPADVLLAAAERYRDDPNREPAYTKLATSWLNAGAWENGPLPPRGGPSGRPQAGDTHRAMERSLSAAQAYRALEDAGHYDPPQITSLARRTA